MVYPKDSKKTRILYHNPLGLVKPFCGKKLLNLFKKMDIFLLFH